MENNNLILQCEKCGTRNRVPKSRLGDQAKCGQCGQLLAKPSLKPIDVSDETFNQEVLESKGPVLMDCWAPWCGPCRMVAPVLDQLAMEYGGRVKITKLNVDENPRISSQYAIRNIPTMLIFKDGKQVQTLVGALPKAEIERHLQALL
ncbi:MAG: thioredoxin TrxC [Desulfobacteraceae bacterium]|nr:MAG: thioredoxin TrxC [Desulfobacteraceae bacterium]